VTAPRILVVDDSEFILQLMQTILENEGFDVELAESAQRALARASESAPDLVVLDVRMPGTDGWELLRELRKLEPTAAVPVIMSSTDAEELGWTLALANGAQAYLAKPFAPAHLLRVVRETAGAAAPAAG
jgi:CheY-like chemotaxis protein